MNDFTTTDLGLSRPLIATECDDCRKTFPARAETNNKIEDRFGRLLCPDCCFHASERSR